MGKNKTILVAPLHWGLGHATRCIPVINALLADSFEVLLASDGGALLLLRKEFPQLQFIELPSYNIRYPAKAKNLKWKLLFNTPHILKTIRSEKKIIAKLLAEGRIDGIISDNRFGIYSEKVPSVYITHQLQVFSGNTTWLTGKIHRKIIAKYDECWVPDVNSDTNLSGELGHPEVNLPRVKYIGPLSRMRKKTLQIIYDVLIIISGPEPQRSIFEKELMGVFKVSKLKTLLVQGVVETDQKTTHINQITVVNFMNTDELEKAINQSDVVVTRSGYTSIMDLAAMNKKAFFIPTPGQFEQEYLAERLKTLRIAPSCDQGTFKIEKLNEISTYSGLQDFEPAAELKALFSLFKSE
jgi:uncharacterized protein (TIGR00661 family)